MCGSIHSTLVSKVLLFVSIIFISITSNTSELQPKYTVDHFQSNQSSNDAQQTEVTNSKTVSIPLNSQNHNTNNPSPGVPKQSELPVPEPNLGTIMEGGGSVSKKLTISAEIPAKNLDETETEVYDSDHIKGSKGRKGVGHLQSSVVARKGVSDTDQSLINDSAAVPKEENNNPAKLPPTMSPASEQFATVSSSVNSTDNKVLKEQPNLLSTKPKHSKKPEIVSDDDFDNYTLIKTSTTGEDYVIIGIVIVIGIWLSVFGALIFYRRAGEYWDRRHYRRMDFLVEGMYND